MNIEAVWKPSRIGKIQLKSLTPRACFEARTLPVNLEIYAGYGLLFNASENKSNIPFENFDVSIGSGKTNK